MEAKGPHGYSSLTYPDIAPRIFSKLNHPTTLALTSFQEGESDK